MKKLLIHVIRLQVYLFWHFSPYSWLRVSLQNLDGGLLYCANRLRREKESARALKQSMKHIPGVSNAH